MTEVPDDQLAGQLKQRLAEQDALSKRFETAPPAEEYKDEIKLGQPYRAVTEFRMDRTAFLVRHTPTEILGEWSIMHGPRRLKAAIEGWVDQIDGAYPSNPGQEQ